MGSSEIGTILAFTADPWESAMVVLRLTGPAGLAGLQIRQGNDKDKIFPEMISEAGIVIIQRDFPRYREAYRQVMGLARAAGKPVIYETDDLLMEIPEDHHSKSYYRYALLPMIEAAVEADLITTSTSSLCDYLRGFNPKTYLLPNYLHDQIWSFQTPPPVSEEAPIVIGYMGGETHLHDLEVITPALQNILLKYGEKVLLRFWGGKPPQALLDSPQVEWHPINQIDYSKFAQYFQEQECHIAIAPLRDGLFNRCKSPIKLLEYSTKGLPGVYSRTPAYEQILEDRVDGFLASNLEEWEEALCQLIESPTLRCQMGLKAQQKVQNRWLLSQHFQEWIEVFREALSQASQPKPQRIHPSGTYMRAVRQLEVQQEEKTRTIDALKGQLADSEKTRIELSRQLDEIQGSRSWNLIQKLIRARTALVPYGSTREQILKKLHILS